MIDGSRNIQNAYIHSHACMPRKKYTKQTVARKAHQKLMLIHARTETNTHVRRKTYKGKSR